MKKYLILCAAASLMVAACSNPYIKQGQVLELSGKTDEAIASYQQAVTHDPKDAEAKACLARVKQVKAAQMVNEAQSAAMIAPQTLSTLSAAISKADSALEADPSYAPAQQLKNQLLGYWQTMVQRRDEIVSLRKEAVSRKDWDSALEKNSLALAMDPDHRDNYEKDAETVRETASASFLGEAGEFIKNRDYPKALRAIEAARKYKDDPRARELADTISQRKQAEDLMTRAQGLVAAKEYAQALPVYGEILALDPDNRSAKKSVADIHRILGEDALKRGSLLEAAVNFRKSGSYASNSDTDSRLSEINGRLVAIGNYRINEYLGMNLPGNALITAWACREVTGTSSFDGAIKNAESQLKLSPQWPTYMVLDMTRSSQSRRKATSFKEPQVELPDRIYGLMKTTHAPFLARRDEVMNQLADMGIKSSDVRYWDIGKLERLATLIDARYIITGNIVDFDVRVNSRRESRSQQYLADTRKNPNPAYSNWVTQKNAVENCKAQQTSRGAVSGIFGLLQGDYQSAARDMAVGALTDCGSYSPTPPAEFLEEKVYATCNYEVNHHQVEGYATVQYLVYDSREARLIFDEKIETAIDKSDDETAGCSAGGIQADPLEIPSEEGMAEMLLAENAKNFYDRMGLASPESILGSLLATAAKQEDKAAGREFLAMASLISPDSPQIKQAFETALKEVQADFTGDAYELAVRAKNYVPAAKENAVAGGRKWAIVVGVDRYQDRRVPRLRYAQNDAASMVQTLVKNGGFARENVKMLLGPNATRAEILASINDLSSRTLPEDTVLIYFAGHGGVEPDNTQPDGYAKYLLPYDADVQKSLYASSISYNEIRVFFEKIKADRLICLLDSCYSGSAGGSDIIDTASASARSVRVVPSFMDSLVSTGKSRVIITASDGNQPSIELPEKQHGVFTYYIIKGMEGEADSSPKDNNVTLTELFQYVSGNVRRDSAQKGRYHEPILKGQTSGGDMIMSSLAPLKPSNNGASDQAPAAGENPPTDAAPSSPQP